MSVGDESMDSLSRSSSEPPLEARVENGDKKSHDDGSPSDEASAPAGSTLQQTAHFSEASPDGAPERISANDAVGRKRSADDEPDSEPPMKILLQDYIPGSCVIDYRTRDRHTVKLTNFVDGVAPEDVNNLCKDAAGIEHKFNKAHRLMCSFARYESEQKAVEAAKALQNAALREHPFWAFYCGERWKEQEGYPEVLYDTLRLHGVPNEFLDKEKLATIFPTGEVLDVPDYGVVQVKFSSPDELLEAIKDPECRTIGGQSMQCAFAVTYKRESESKFEKKPDGVNEQDTQEVQETEYEQDNIQKQELQEEVLELCLLS